MQQLSPLKPLTRLCSLKSMRQVDSPQSDRKQAPISSMEQSSNNEISTIYSALEFSIDDLFSKIQKITSEFNYDADYRSMKTIQYGNQNPLENLKKTHSETSQFTLKERNSNIDPYPVEPVRHISQKIQFTETISPPKKINRQLHQRNSKLKIEDFQLGKTVGSGKFGDVLQCRHKSTGTLYALKKIFKSTIMEYNMVEQFIVQLKIHYSLDHPNIVKLYTHFEDKYHIFLLMQYVDGGMLMNYTKKQQKFVSNILLQVFNAVQYLHRNHIAHRDIKPQNIVISNGVAKLCDFGWAANCQTGMKKTFCGTLDYVSPEILQQKQYNIDVDLWSLGILTFQMLVGFPPFQDDITKLKMQKIRNVEKNGILFPPQINPQPKDLINRFLKKDPNQRIKIRDAYIHPFIKKYMGQEQINPEILCLFD